MFDFTNSAPPSEKVWAELEKESFERIDSGKRRNVRLMLWIMLRAGKNFKGSKKILNDTISGRLNESEIRQAFVGALRDAPDLTMTVDVNSIQLPDAKCDKFIVLDVADELRTPVLLFKSLVKNQDIEDILTLANKVFDVSDLMEEGLKADYNFDQLQLLENITPYQIGIMPQSHLFAGNSFRKYFRPPTDDVVSRTIKIEKIDDVQTVLRDDLLSAIVNGNPKEYYAPTIKLVKETTEEGVEGYEAL